MGLRRRLSVRALAAFVEDLVQFPAPILDNGVVSGDPLVSTVLF